MANKIETEATPIAEKIADELGYEVVDVEYVKESSDWYLRVYIDKEGGVGIDDCETFSRRMSDALDEMDFISAAYIFEVSSPGVERALKKEKDFIRYQGRKINVKLFKAIDGVKTFECVLEGFEDSEVIVNVNGEVKRINIKDIASAKLAFEF